MNNKNEYMCPICGEGTLCTDIADDPKWGRAYCNSCDCGGPEVRTGYDESLDAPWRTEARKQFVEVVNEHVAKRCPWVKTADRLPDKCDDTKYLIARQRICGEWHTLQVTGLYIKKYPTRCPWWIPIPPLPEVEK